MFLEFAVISTLKDRGHVKQCLTNYLFHLECSQSSARVIMEVTLKKIGNSTGLVMPPPVLRDLGLSVGRSFRLQTTADGKIILEPKRKFQLADMIAQCDLKAEPPADMKGWNNMPAVGGELW